MRICFVLAAMVAAFPLPAAAQGNLIVNGSFDSDLNGWNLGNPLSGYLEWSPADVDGSTDSGSARVVNTDTAAFSVTLYQCVPATEGLRYDAATTLYIPPGQGWPGYVYMRVVWSTAADCNGGWLAVLNHPIMTTLGAWETQSLSDVVPPATTQGAQLEVVVFKSVAGGQFEVLVDNAMVVGEVPLFSDGFESGNLSAWDAELP